ncbi:MAG: ATP-dependent helicase, partial [bacterium]|nr:ATP-dependent helicase [bacterium]
RAWQIEQIGHNDVFVRPAKAGGAMIPFWRAEDRDRGFLLAERISTFLAQAEVLLADARRADLEQLIRTDYPVQENAVQDLVNLLQKQRSHCEAPLPHRKHLLVEYYRDPHNNQERRQVILHTFWGGRINRPFAMAIASAWEQEHGHPLEVMHTDDCIVLALQDGFTLDDILRPVRSDTLTGLLRRQLSRSGLFGARFRENAGCALLLPRGDFRRRLPLWLNRMRSKKLMAAVSEHADFPITLETWRGCLQETFDLDNLSLLLDELQDREIEISEAYTDTPSPFSKEVVWKHTNQEMYNDDRPEHDRGAVPGDDWLREVTLSSSLRPHIEPALSHELQRKLQRTFPGYAPRGADELLNWVKERVAIPEPEWEALLQAIRDEGEPDPVPALGDKLQWLAVGNGRMRVAAETLERLPVLALLGHSGVASRDGEARERAFDPDEAGQVFREWLRFFGPIPVDTVERIWGLCAQELAGILEPLIDNDEIVVDRLHAHAQVNEVCDSQNLETLLRWTRSRSRKPFETLGIESLGLFWAVHQGVISEGTGDARKLGDVLTQLATLGAPAGVWEKEVLPARLRPYHTSWLDTFFAEGELLWCGMGNEKLSFVLPEDLPLLPCLPQADEAQEPAPLPGALAGSAKGRHKVFELATDSGQSSVEVSDRLWRAAWQGLVSNDGYTSVRQGVIRRFRDGAAAAPQTSPRGRRRRLGRERSRPHAGAWFNLPDRHAVEQDLDPLDHIERNKERARILLDRYGVVFREVVAREPNGFKWRDIFMALRLMELSGEVTAGHFFSEIHGLQFASAEAAQRLRRPLPSDAVYWVSAMDPACANGLGLGGALSELPHRRASSHVVFHGTDPVIVSTSGGKELTIRLEPDTPEIAPYFEFFKVALTRGFAPRTGIEIETINGERATRSAWRARLAELFDLSASPRTVTLQRRY